jgi:hypothetical protein
LEANSGKSAPAQSIADLFAALAVD